MIHFEQSPRDPTDRREIRREKKERKRRRKQRKRGCGLSFPLLLLLVLFAAALWARPQKEESDPLDTLTQVPYYSLIVDLSKKNGLPPPLTAAVIRQESRFIPQARSRVGAQGLMQIMPDTGKYIAKKRGLAYSEKALDQPKTNIDYGTWLLKGFLDRFDGEIETALAAYNAGPTITAKWLKDPNYSRDGKTLYAIPYEETRNYVKKVMGYYQLYQAQYLEKDKAFSADGEANKEK